MTDYCRAASRVLSYAAALLETMDAGSRPIRTSSSWGRGSTTLRASSARRPALPRNTAPNACFDVPLMEEGMTGIAIGAALVGTIRITTHIRADFAFLAMNQIINLAAKYRYMFGGS